MCFLMSVSHAAVRFRPIADIGGITPGGFSLSYRFPDALYVNRFERQGSGWRWTIVEQSSGKPDKLFAQYNLKPRSCRGMTFGF